MKLSRRGVRFAVLVSAWGALLAHGVTAGCVASLQHNLELVLAPAAPENALVIPYSSVSRLATWVARLLR